MSIKTHRGFSTLCRRRVQRFFSRTLNVCNIFALGRMHLERLIQIKKLLFIRSIMVLDDQILSKKIFVDPAMYHFNNQDGHI